MKKQFDLNTVDSFLGNKYFIFGCDRGLRFCVNTFKEYFGIPQYIRNITLVISDEKPTDDLNYYEMTRNKENLTWHLSDVRKLEDKHPHMVSVDIFLNSIFSGVNPIYIWVEYEG